ncbi:MAG: nitroreductase family deazaflavin-dependent oxidoreductase [Candidatus Binatia bacterium]
MDRSWARVYSLGLVPDFLVTLEVKGRLRSRMHSTALVVAECNGEKYVVAMLGTSTAWVRNVQATGGEAIVRHGRSQNVRLVEVPRDQRAPVLKAYLQRAIVARPHFPVAWNAPLDAFEKVAARYPVFRIIST